MKRLAFFLLIMIALTACTGSRGSPGTKDMTLASIAISSGDNQTAVVGTQLSAPLVAQVLNKQGQPIPGFVVNFVVTSGGGEIFAKTMISDANGLAGGIWTLGTIAGVQTMEARAITPSGTIIYATFSAIATVGEPKSIDILSGNNQTAQQLQQLPLLLSVVVNDTYRNPVAGVPVAFIASDGGATTPSSSVTDVHGSASTMWKLGPTLGVQTLNATISASIDIKFSAVATQAPPGEVKAIIKISGDEQAVSQYLLLPYPLQVIAIDQLGNPVPELQITFFSATSGSDYNNPQTIITNTSGIASWAGYFYNTGQQNTTASAAGVTPIEFTTSVLASTHKYDGIYLCNLENTGLYGLTPFRFSIVNGQPYSDSYTDSHGGISIKIGGTFNENDATLLLSVEYNSIFDFARHYFIDFTSSLTIDSLGNITGSGVWMYKAQLAEHNGNGTCSRK
ncbi:hypothetical protein GETHOR_25540 [Geothrix oryzae]|uniref:Big-1 domain-containing protein n=1 Tax=Geothrix oryzae TaxID=2927975 RepID=A0ABN6V1N9_9BACT|nr:Ig-like domain-containing protein [Geothrix oryzae]BDU70453.1 hypothetical protein GETHOR_25540 [Geothrix oryzae]